MQRPFTAVLIVLLIGVAGSGAAAPTPLAARQWLDTHLLRCGMQPPESDAIPRSSDLLFSFEYGGRASDDLLATWPKRTLSEKLDTVRTRHTVTWTDSRSGLDVRCVAVGYADFPAVEWIVYFENTGEQDTPIIEALQGLDARIERKGSGEFLLHHWRGDTCGRDL